MTLETRRPSRSRSGLYLLCFALSLWATGPAANQSDETRSDEEIIEDAALIFRGRAIYADRTSTTYRVLALFKGKLSGDMVEVAGMFPEADYVGTIVAEYVADAHGSGNFRTARVALWGEYLINQQPHIDAYRFAHEDAEAVVKRHKGLITAWQALTALEHRHNDSLSLLESLPQLIALTPKDPIPLIWLASTKRRMFRHDEAVTLYDAALEMAPANLEALKGRIQSLAELGRVEGIDERTLDFGGLHFNKLNLSARHFKGASFVAAELREVDFQKADLRAADFTKAQVDTVQFSGADLRQAHFGGAWIWDSNFSQANLEGADFSNLRCSRLRFEGAHLAKADLRKTHISGGDFRDADLRGADLRGADVSDSDFSSAQLEGANLDGLYYQAMAKWPPAFEPHKAGAIERR